MSILAGLHDEEVSNFQTKQPGYSEGISTIQQALNDGIVVENGNFVGISSEDGLNKAQVMGLPPLPTQDSARLSSKTSSLGYTQPVESIVESQPSQESVFMEEIDVIPAPQGPAPTSIPTTYSVESIPVEASLAYVQTVESAPPQVQDVPPTQPPIPQRVDSIIQAETIQHPQPNSQPYFQTFASQSFNPLAGFQQDSTIHVQPHVQRFQAVTPANFDPLSGFQTREVEPISPPIQIPIAVEQHVEPIPQAIPVPVPVVEQIHEPIVAPPMPVPNFASVPMDPLVVPDHQSLLSTLQQTITTQMPVIPIRSKSQTFIGHDLASVDSSTISTLDDEEGWMSKLLTTLNNSSRVQMHQNRNSYQEKPSREKAHAQIRLKLTTMDPKAFPKSQTSSRPPSRQSSQGDFTDDEDLSGLPPRGTSLYTAEGRHHLSTLALDKIMTEGSTSPPSSHSSDTTSIVSTEEGSVDGELKMDGTLTLEAAKTGVQLAKVTIDLDERFNILDYLFEHMNNLPSDTPALQQESIQVVNEAVKLLKRLALTHFHPQSQYALGNFYIAGFPEKFDETYAEHPELEKDEKPSKDGKKKPNYSKAVELWIMAAKRFHPDACYNVGLCTEKGLGTRASDARAVKYYRKAASLNHPGAMTRLALALLKGELGMKKHERDGVKWLKIASKYADKRFSQALLELALLHAQGIEHVILRDDRYCVELLMRGADLGNAECQWRLGRIFETQKIDDDVHSPLVVEMDGKQALNYFQMAAAQGHVDSMLEISRWYMTGWNKAGFELKKSPSLAMKWAHVAADKGSARGMFAVGYFLEFGIGTPPNKERALEWYRKASELGDEQARIRLNLYGVKSGKAGVMDNFKSWLRRK